MPMNFEDIKNNIKGLLADLNLHKSCDVSIGSSTNLGRAKDDPRFFSTIEEMRLKEAETIHKLAREGAYKLPLFSRNSFQRTCGHGGAVTVSADGNIYPCSITEQPSIGNVLDDNAGELMASVRKFIEATNVDNIEGCNKWDIRYFCAGICRITNHRRTGSYFISGCTEEYKNLQIRILIRKYESFEIIVGGTLDLVGQRDPTVLQASAE